MILLDHPGSLPHPLVAGSGGMGAAMRSGTPPGGPRGILAMEADVPVDVDTVSGVVIGVEKRRL